jgi:two-component system, NarL family, sensor histidine kinase BarA
VSALPGAERGLEALTLEGRLKLEELVDRKALGEMAQTVHELFRVPIRIFAEGGALLADTSEPIAIYEYISQFRGVRARLQETITQVKQVDLAEAGEASVDCVTGAKYHVVGIDYDHRLLGRFVLGPFLPVSVVDVPSCLVSVAPDTDPERLQDLLPRMPRAREEAVRHIGRHLRATLELSLFSGHKALLASSMHLASIKESYRDLQAKNAALQDAYDRLKELDRLKSNFLATVSHELRTPLTSIIGYSEMLVEGIAGPMPDDQKDFVRTIHEKGEQLLELISGLLDLSKLESGTMSMKRVNLDVSALVADVVLTLEPEARRRGVELVRAVDAPLPELRADPARLRQVLLNLGENALKFTPKGGTVTFGGAITSVAPDTADTDGGGFVLLGARQTAVVLTVADTGIGIPDPEKSRVFDPFYQVDSSSTRQVGGTGLGLSIVKRLVDAHNGTVRIEDNAPTGTVFVVTIPCRRATIY